MADAKITELDNNTTIDDADLIVIVDDVAGTPVTEKRTIGELKSHIGSGTPGGADTQIQFNDDGVFGGIQELTYNATTKSLTYYSTLDGSNIYLDTYNTADTAGAGIGISTDVAGEETVDMYAYDGSIQSGIGIKPDRIILKTDSASDYNFVNENTGIGGILDFSNVITTSKTFTFPNQSGTLALLEAPNAFTVGGQSITVADTTNVVGLTINQNDVTNNLPGVTIVKAATGYNLSLQSTHATNSGAAIEMYHNSASPSTSDNSYIEFYGNNDAAEKVFQGAVFGVWNSTTNGSEEGALEFWATSGGLEYNGGIGVTTDSNGSGLLYSLGNEDLILKTGNATTGTITIVDGANGDISLIPNGSGSVVLDDISITGDIYSAPGAGEINGISYLVAGVGDTYLTVYDDSYDEIVRFTRGAGSAVNELTFTAATTTNNPTISATGGDTDIGINLTPKGAGDVVIESSGTQSRLDIISGTGGSAYIVADDGNDSGGLGVYGGASGYLLVNVSDSDAYFEVNNSSSNLLFDGADGLSITSNATGATGAVLELYQNSSSPANSDVVGAINFYGEDSASNKQLYAGISARITDVTSTSEDADLYLSTTTAGTYNTTLILRGSALLPNVDDAVSLGTTGTRFSDLHLATGGNITVNGSNPKRTLVLTAAGGTPTTTAGCAAATKIEAGTNDIDYYVLDFDTTTEERAFWNVVMPDNWDGSTLTAVFYWTNASGSSTQTVDWGIKARAFADSDAIDQAYGSEITTTDTWLAQGDVHISAASSAITVGGSPAGGQYVVFNVGRKVASDNMTGDARLLSVKIEYGINAYSD